MENEFESKAFPQNGHFIAVYLHIERQRRKNGTLLAAHLTRTDGCGI